jgi:hypothetical protein
VIVAVLGGALVVEGVPIVAGGDGLGVEAVDVGDGGEDGDGGAGAVVTRRDEPMLVGPPPRSTTSPARPPADRAVSTTWSVRLVASGALEPSDIAPVRWRSPVSLAWGLVLLIRKRMVDRTPNSI